MIVSAVNARMNIERQISPSSDQRYQFDIPDWYPQPNVTYAFNLPRASAQLERLMGTNVVRLTDRKYMMELRQRIHEDFNDMLDKRIQNREHEESLRQIGLVLDGSYNDENCPEKLIGIHSVVLAKELERLRVLLIEGKTNECPKELANHPVFLVNQMTNNTITKRRAKLKTKRERNAEYLLRQGAKWERERLMYEAAERKREADLKEQQNEALTFEQKNIEKSSQKKMGLLSIRDRSYTEEEDDLKNFLARENDLMANRLKPKEQIFDPYTKETRLVDEKRKQNEAARMTLKSLVGKINDKLVKRLDGNDLSNKKSNSSQYVDPKLDRLKQTDNVREMYILAEEIVDGVPNERFEATNKFDKSDEAD